MRRQADLNALRECWAGWLANEQITLLVDDGCFAIAVHAQADFSSGQPETIVVQQVGLNAQMLRLVRERALERGDEFLAFRHYPEEVELGQRLPELGLAPEVTRVTRDTRALLPVTVPVRPANGSDLAFMGRLHVEFSPFYQSSNRRGMELGAMEVLSNYLSLDLLRYPGWVDRERQGYVLLERDFSLDLLERKGVYLYDIAVQPSSWGRGLAVSLHEAAMQGALEAGYQTVIGDIACENERALGVATEKLGYAVEWRRWGCNL